MTTEKTDTPRLLEAAEIVRRLAPTEPLAFMPVPDDHLVECRLCNAYRRPSDGPHRDERPFPHAPLCPWLAARRWVEAGMVVTVETCPAELGPGGGR